MYSKVVLQLICITRALKKKTLKSMMITSPINLCINLFEIKQRSLTKAINKKAMDAVSQRHDKKFNQDMINRTLENLEIKGAFYEQQLCFLLVAATLEDNQELLEDIKSCSMHSIFYDAKTTSNDNILKSMEIISLAVNFCIYLHDKGEALKILTSYQGYKEFILYINPFTVAMLNFLDQPIKEEAEINKSVEESIDQEHILNSLTNHLIKILFKNGVIIYQSNDKLNKLILKFCINYKNGLWANDSYLSCPSEINGHLDEIRNDATLKSMIMNQDAKPIHPDSDYKRSLAQSKSVRDNLDIFQKMKQLIPNRDKHSFKDDNDRDSKSRKSNNISINEEEKSEIVKLHKTSEDKELEYSDKAKIYFGVKQKKYKVLGIKEFDDITIALGKMISEYEIFYTLYDRYFNSQTEDEWMKLIFPKEAFLSCVFYEDVQTFGAMVRTEYVSQNHYVEKVISECFIKALNLNKIITALFILKRYPDVILRDKESVLASILHYFKEFTEDHNFRQFKGSIRYFEERLYIIEISTQYISYSNAKYFLEIIQKILTIHSQMTLNDIESNCFVSCTNPLKVYVLVLKIIIDLEKVHHNLTFFSVEVKQLLHKHVIKYIEGVNSISKITTLLEEKCYNKRNVIDIIANYSLFDILSSPKVDIVVNNYWKGIYECDFFLNRSTCYILYQNQLSSSAIEIDKKSVISKIFLMSNLLNIN